MLRAWTVLSKKWVIATSIASITFVNISVAHSNAYGVGSLNSNTLFQQQNTTLTGIVTDETNQPLPGVSVVVKGTSIGIVTDGNGKYSISAPANANISFTVLGYQPQEFPASGGPTINVKLVPIQTQLDEVVVVGYGEQKKATLTGSISSVQGSEIAKNPSPNVTASLAGRLPGLVVNQRSGEPGRDDPSLVIRGGASLGANGPLIVIDGVPGRGNFSRLNAEDIESVTILKDGSAAIYGNRAANGVILVTTKKGTKGKPTFDFTYNYGFQSPTKTPQMLDAVTYAEVYNEGTVYRGGAGTPPFYTPDVIQKLRDGSDPVNWPATDWVKLVSKSYAPQERMNLQVNGGGDNSRYLLSFGTLSQSGYFKYNPTDSKQYNFRAKLDVDISKYLSISANINGMVFNRTYSPVGTPTNFVNILQANPILVARYPNGLLGGGRLGENPLLLDQRGVSKSDDLPLYSTFTATFKIPWVTGLKFDASFNYDVGNTFNKSFSIPYFYYQYNTATLQYEKKNGTTGSAELTDNWGKSNTVLYNYRLSYDTNIGRNHIMAMVGAEQQQSYSRLGSAYRKNFISTNFDQIDFGSPAGADLRNSGSANRGAYNNVFGRATYDYASKYIFDFNFRYDGSQIFPPSKRYGFFPSFQGAWRISEEDFMKSNFPFVDQLKVRATYGELGSDSPASGGGYQFAQFYGFGGNYVFGTSDLQGVVMQTLPNPNFTWEIAKKTDFGIEGSLWKGLLGFDLTVFRERRSGILIQRNFSASKVYGFPGLPPENLGEVENHGYELQFTHRNKIGKFFYNVRANMQYNISKVIYMDEVPNTYEYRNQTGRPLGATLLYQADGIFNTQAELDGYPHQANQKLGDIKVVDINGDGVINQNDQFRFNYNNTPKYVFGLNLDLQYSNFDMNIFLYGQTKAYNYDGAFASLGNTDFSNGSVYRAADRWTPSNPNGTMPRTDFYQPGNTTFFMNDATFFRLKTLELGYTIPKSIISKIKISNVRVFVSGYNLLTYSPKIKWSDPEVNGNFVNYPPQRVINLGANVRF